MKKDSRGDVCDAGSMLIFPADFLAIYGEQALYFLDPEMGPAVEDAAAGEERQFA